MHKIFMNKIVSLEFQTGRVKEAIKLILENSKRSTDLIDVLKRYCSGLDDTVSNKFYFLFGDEYKAYIKSMNSKQ
jgi:hypothetical protein